MRSFAKINPRKFSNLQDFEIGTVLTAHALNHHGVMYPVGLEIYEIDLSLHLYPCIVYTSSKGSGECAFAYLRRLARAFVA